MPWLPVVAVRGRLRDRAAGWPSVEEVKEWLYADADAASQLTGAFRLAPGGAAADSQVTLLLQAKDDDAVAVTKLGQRLAQSAARQLPAVGTLEVVEATKFLHRPLIDYERKFRYAA